MENSDGVLAALDISRSRSRATQRLASSARVVPYLNVMRQQPMALHSAGRSSRTTPSAWVKGDPGTESVFLWTKEKKGVNRCGAEPMGHYLPGGWPTDVDSQIDPSACTQSHRLSWRFSLSRKTTA